jgi:hypothetical protein
VGVGLFPIALSVPTKLAQLSVKGAGVAIALVPVHGVIAQEFVAASPAGGGIGDADAGIVGVCWCWWNVEGCQCYGCCRRHAHYCPLHRLFLFPAPLMASVQRVLACVELRKCVSQRLSTARAMSAASSMLVTIFSLIIAVVWDGSETVPDSPINLVPQSLAAGWGYLLAPAGEGAERVRLVGGGIRVGAGRCFSHNEGSESDSRADQYFRDHLVALSRHVITLSFEMKRWLDRACF